jgi:hypothetical protein
MNLSPSWAMGLNEVGMDPAIMVIWILIPTFEAKAFWRYLFRFRKGTLANSIGPH